MKIILLPLFKYSFFILVALSTLICTLIFYPITILWEFKIMKWGEYMNYNYCWGTNYQDYRICEMLLKENFFDTIRRWINFEYAIFIYLP